MSRVQLFLRCCVDTGLPARLEHFPIFLSRHPALPPSSLSSWRWWLDNCKSFLRAVYPPPKKKTIFEFEIFPRYCWWTKILAYQFISKTSQFSFGFYPSQMVQNFSKSQVIWRDFWNFKTSTKEVQNPSESQNNSQPDKNLFQPNCFFWEKPTNQPAKPFSNRKSVVCRLLGLASLAFAFLDWSFSSCHRLDELMDGWDPFPKNYTTTIPRSADFWSTSSSARMRFFSHIFTTGNSGIPN